MRDSPYPPSIKTSAPALVGVIERARLIDALAKLPAPAKWLQSASGTGKSTLAASYARSQTKPLAWYRFDERDNDPAFFYEHFSEAVGAQLNLAGALPRFSADDHSRQQVFAQHYFGTLAAQIDGSAMIVADDVHRLTAHSMQASLAAMIDVAGARLEQLFVSEETTPTPFFDAIAARRLVLLNDADLHFNVDECKSMGAMLRIGGKQCEDIAALTGGHAGALVLACELLRSTGARSALGAQTAERIHLHLLSKLVERMPEMRHELLLQTAFVSQLTRGVAVALAGGEAAKQLDGLAETGLLRRVGSGADEVFEAHGLVRQGMQSLVRAQLGHTKAQGLAQKTATTLIEHGQREAAFAVFVQIGSYASALEVLQDLAENYAAQGQVDLLMASLEKLPAVDVEHDAWLCFWTGQAQLRIDEEQARVWFGRSFMAFEAKGDLQGMRLSAAANLTAFRLECGDVRDLGAWVDHHQRAGGDTPISTGDRFEATLILGVICAAFVRARYPSQIDSDALTDRLRFLLDSSSGWLSDDQRVQAAKLLIEHCCTFSRFEQGVNVVVATRSLIDDETGSALQRGRWLSVAASLYAGVDADKAAHYLNEARLLAEQFEASHLLFELGVVSANYLMKAQDLSGAATELVRLQQLATKAAPAHRAQYAKLMTRLLLLRGQVVEGLQWAEEAIRIAAAAGYYGAHLRAFEMELVYALAANERLADAADLISRMEFEPREARSAVESCVRFLLQGDIQLLRKGLRDAAQINFINLLDRARGPLTRVCSAALESEIEPDFVRQVIRLKQLRPPPLTGPQWPWLVRVRTLGGFRLDIQGKRYQPPHKAQDKPLELLKLLVTCQALGRASVDKNWIVERLWADSAPENARKSLDMAVSRLRRLLGEESAIVAYEGRLQLSTDSVWTDIQQLRNALSEAQRQRDAKAAGNNIVSSEATAVVTTVLQLYVGPYLINEEEPPWLLAGREAIVAGVRQVLLTADVVLEGSADDVLIPALEKALLNDPASEDLARSLMRAFLRRERHSEAIQVYRRLRQTLSLLLGIAPSPETDHIRDRAYTEQCTTSP